jgi:hypothetical protein
METIYNNPAPAPATARRRRTLSDYRASASLSLDVARLATALYVLAGIVMAIVVMASTTDTSGYYDQATHPYIGAGFALIAITLASASLVYAVLSYLRWRVAEGE